MAYPTVRAVGTIASGTGTIAPALPSGTAAGDLLLMVIETANETATCAGWTEAYAAQGLGTAGSTGATRCTVLYKIAVGSDATTTNDPGNHIAARIIGITAGTFNPLAPINAGNGNTDTPGNTSITLPEVITTVPECLIVLAVTGDLPDPTTQGTAEFSSWTNANLGSLTERIDNTRNAGNGGALGAATGTLLGVGRSGTTSVTAATTAVRGKIVLAIAPLPDTYETDKFLAVKVDDGMSTGERLVGYLI